MPAIQAEFKKNHYLCEDKWELQRLLIKKSI